MKVTFQVLEGVDKGRTFRELATPVTIGREEGNLLRLNDERVSRLEHYTAGLDDQARRDREESRQLWRETQQEILSVSRKLCAVATSVPKSNAHCCSFENEIVSSLAG